MAGRRQPTDLVKAKGKKHMTKAEEEQRRSNEVKTPSVKSVRAPKWLPEELKKDFKELSKQLIDLGIFCSLDRDTLGRYLVAQKSWEQASKDAMKALSRHDSEGAAEWSAIQDRYFKQCRACAGDLGLTISSRCQLVIPQTADDDGDDPILSLISFPEARSG